MALTAYVQPPPDGMGDYLAGKTTRADGTADGTADGEDHFERFHRAHVADARLSDCGRPDAPDFHRGALFERQPKSVDDDDPRFHRGRRFVYCPDGHRLKLDRRPGGDGYHFRHWPDGTGRGCRFKPSPAESLEHKSIKGAAASAFRKTGATAETERKTASLRSQPDITVTLPDGRKLGIEIQASSIGGEGVAARRTRYLVEDGYVPIWLTTRQPESWQQRVPCLVLRKPFEGSGDDRYYVTVRRVSHERCRSRCWYKRWSGEKTCPGHYVGAAVLSFEDLNSGRQRREVRFTLDEFAQMFSSGGLVEARLPKPSLDDRGLPVITFADDDAELAREHFVTYVKLFNSEGRRAETPRERLPECTKKSQPKHPDDVDAHGEHDAQISIDREFVQRRGSSRPTRAPNCGDWVTFADDTDELLSGLVHAVDRDGYGRHNYGIRYWREIKDGVTRRFERGEDVVTADRIRSIKDESRGTIRRPG